MIKAFSKICILFFAFLFCTNIGFAKLTEEQQDAINTIKYMNYSYSEQGFNLAIRKGRKDVVELFIKSGMSPNTTFGGQPVTFAAVYFGQNDILDYLLTNGANINANNVSNNLLTYSIFIGNTEAIDILVKHHFNINEPFSSTLPIDYAISRNEAGSVVKLIEKGAIVNKSTYKRAGYCSNPLIKKAIEDAYNKQRS